MNSEIDLKNFGENNNSQESKKHPGGLVSPPRRIFTRYFLPMLLLAGFVIVGTFAFRESLVRPVVVMITMPLAAASATNPETGESLDTTPATERISLFQAPGWIEPEPYPIRISALRMGTVESIKVIEGETVTSGAVIAKLVDEDARLALDGAKSALMLKQARYQAALNHWKNPTTLVESVATARATGTKLEAEARRLQEMLELAQVEANVGLSLSQGGYEASLETLRKKTQLIASRNQLAETTAQISLNSATLTAATERLSLRIEDKEAVEAAHAELLAAQTAREMAQLDLDRSIIHAPTSGTIMRLMVSPGSMLSKEMANGMVLATLYQPDKLQVRADVPLSEAAKVRPGLAAEITVEALPDRVFKGALVNIVPEFDLQKNILPVKVRIYDPVQILRPEMIARVEFFQEGDRLAGRVSNGDRGTTGSTRSGAADELLLIPQELLIVDGDKTNVLLAGPDGYAHRREVAAGKPDANGFVPISKGLRISDKILVSPDANVQDGTPIKIKGFTR